MIKIVSKQEGFRRCGVAHSRQATEYADDRFTKEELKILRSEPMLVVEGGDGDDSDDNGSGEGGKTTRLNAKDSIEAVKVVATIEELNKLAEGEDRKSVVDAIAKRRTELEPPQQ